MHVMLVVLFNLWWHGCRSVPAPEQLAVLHNASSWLREYGLAADSRTAKLLFQYLAHQDLTFEQVSASQLAEAVQQLSQVRLVRHLTLQ